MEHGLNPALVCAVIEQESAWDPCAIRYDPAFSDRYIIPMLQRGEITSKTDAVARAISWGLMQVMGQTAREHGFTGTYLSELTLPGYAVEIGCKVLAESIRRESGDIARGLERYNGGGNPDYATEVMARMSKYIESDE